jgi:hypothetical protein
MDESSIIRHWKPYGSLLLSGFVKARRHLKLSRLMVSAAQRFTNGSASHQSLVLEFEVLRHV